MFNSIRLLDKYSCPAEYSFCPTGQPDLKSFFKTQRLDQRFCAFKIVICLNRQAISQSIVCGFFVYVGGIDIKIKFQQKSIVVV